MGTSGRLVAKSIVVGIDATNLRQGGGVTHLVELLRAAEPAKHGIARVIVWGCTSTLTLLDNLPWLTKINPIQLERGLLQRTLWQCFCLSREAQAVGCDVLFVPGGSFFSTPLPVVTMSRNMLPFERRELLRYGWGSATLKMLVLKWVQSHAFRKADAVIFLTAYAMSGVLKHTGSLNGLTKIVPHGISSRFQIAPRSQRPVFEYSEVDPFKVLYVSVIEPYKHQWHVVEAIATLRSEGYPLALDLVGPAYAPALKRLKTALTRFDPKGVWIRYHGAMPFAELHQKYGESDLGIFASSCENMPNILLETMAAGLPVACSRMGPMPEVLGNSGSYFDPEVPSDIARALRELIVSPQLRAERARGSHETARSYSWKRCADSTFDFLAAIANQRHNSHPLSSRHST